MAQTIKLKRSSTSGAVPTTSQLELGEVAINTYDGKMYIKKNVGGTETIVDITGGGGSSSSADSIVQEYQYTATANQTTFSGADDNSETLAYTAGAIQIFLNGVLLDPSTDYTASNTINVVLTSGAAAGDYLQIFAFKQKISDGNVTVNTFSGNNSTTAFTLSLDPGDENNTRVFVDGVYQSKSNYSVSGTTLTFSTAPPSGTAIEVEIGNRNVTLDTASNLDLPDNVKLRLGTGQDLQIYSDGTNSYIEERNTTSGLRITSDNQVAIRKHDNENIALFNVDGAVRLYHDNSQKFETTSTGVDVTGNIVVSGTVDGRDVASDGAAAVAALPRTGGAMTGAITTNSTFDGRDVATDGAKLDGIEAGATADQTQSEINALGITATGLSGTPAISVANITTTGELRGPASFTIDPAAVGDNTGTVVIKGNLQVDGATTTINSTTLTVDDLNLTLASGAANGTAANGAGITVDGASATITYASSDDSWAVNKRFKAQSDIRLGSDGVRLSTDGNGEFGVGYGQTATNNRFTVYNNTTAAFRILPNGNVGIGTTSPSSKLVVADSNGAGLEIIPQTSNDRVTMLSYDRNANTYQTVDFDASDIHFNIAGTEKARINSSGNVGIGTTSPALQSGGTGIHINAGSYSEIKFTNSTTGTTASDGTALVSSGNDFQINNREAGKLKLRTSNTDALTVDSNGNVGIGTTNPQTALHIYDTPAEILRMEGNDEFAYASFYGTVSSTAQRLGYMGFANDTSTAADFNFANNQGGIFSFNAGIDVTGAITSSANGAITTANGTTARFSVNETGGAITAMDARGSTGNIGTRSNHTLGFLVNDVQKATLTANGDFSVTNDIKVTTTNPRIDFDGGNSGALRFFSTSAAEERMRITSGGNVGIGTNTPGKLLTLSRATEAQNEQLEFRNVGGISNGNFDGIKWTQGATGGTMLAEQRINYYTTGVVDMSFNLRNEDNVLYLKAGGNVGIGTSSPYGATHWKKSSTVNLIATNSGADGQTDTTVMSLIGQARGYSNNLSKLASIDFKTDPTTWYYGAMTFNVANLDGTDTSRTPLEAMRINRLGNVGIGTTTPQHELVVASTGNTTLGLVGSGYDDAIAIRFGGGDLTNALGNGNSGAAIISQQAVAGGQAKGDLRFQINTGDQLDTAMFISNVGNVGIGTNTPGALLDLETPGNTADGTFYSTVTINNTGTNTFSGIRLDRSAVAKWRVGLMTDDKFHIANLFTGGSASSPDDNAFVIDNNSNVGIGTSSPTENLHIYHATSNADVKIEAASAGDDSRLFIRRNNSTSRAYLNYSDASSGANWYTGLLRNTTNIFAIGQGDDFGSNTRLCIDNSGKVGIGTTSPAQNLHVEGTTSIIHVQSTTANQNASIWFNSNVGGTQANRWEIGTNISAAGDLEFFDRLNSVSRMVIEPSGNVGIGTISPNNELEVKNSNPSGNTTIFVHNNSASHAAMFKARGERTGANSDVSQFLTDNSGKTITNIRGATDTTSTSGRLEFWTAASSSNAVQRMVIDDAGNVIQGNSGNHSWTAKNTTLFSAGGIGITSNSDWCLQLAGSTSERIRFFTSAGGSSTVGNISVDTAGTTYNTTSDRRLKKDIKTLTDGTDKLMAMNPVAHGWKDNPEAGTVHGFIAQEMINIVPEAVSGDPEGDEMMSMDYGRITPVIVAALQDAVKEIKELKIRINELENR